MVRAKQIPRSEAGTGRELVAPDVPPWERLITEDASDYAAFIAYRDLPLGGRTIRRMIDDERARREKGEGESFPLSDEALRALMNANHWPERAAAWDALVQQANDLQAIALARGTSLDQAELAKAMLEASKGFYDELKLRLEQGALRKMTNKELLGFMSAAVRSAEASARMLRLQGGLPTENVAVAGRFVVASEGHVLDLSQLTTQEIREARAALIRAAAPPEPVIEGEFVEEPDDSDES